MQVSVHFYSYFKNLTGCTETRMEIPGGATIQDLFSRLERTFPKLEAMRKSTLIAVGVDYQTWDYIVKEGDRISLFPPVQGG